MCVDKLVKKIIISSDKTVVSTCDTHVQGFSTTLLVESLHWSDLVDFLFYVFSLSTVVIICKLVNKMCLYVELYIGTKAKGILNFQKKKGQKEREILV